MSQMELATKNTIFFLMALVQRRYAHTIVCALFISFLFSKYANLNRQLSTQYAHFSYWQHYK